MINYQNINSKDLMYKVSTLVDQQQFDDAIQCLDQLIKRNISQAYFYKGQILRLLVKDSSNAQICYNEYLKREPKDIKGYYTLYDFYMIQNKTSKAVQTMKNITKLFPDNFNHHYTREIQKQKINKIQYKTSTQYSLILAWASNYLGLICYQLKEYEESFYAFQDAYSRGGWKQIPELRLRLARAFIIKEQYGQADIILRRCNRSEKSTESYKEYKEIVDNYKQQQKNQKQKQKEQKQKQKQKIQPQQQQQKKENYDIEEMYVEQQYRAQTPHVNSSMIDEREQELYKEENIFISNSWY